MQLNNDRHIDELMERFFNGETSNAEEQELYRFFARKDVPDHLKKYQPVFGFFETGIAHESDSSVNEATAAMKSGIKHLTLRRTWLWSGIAAVAASLLLFLFLNKGSFNHVAYFFAFEFSIPDEPRTTSEIESHTTQAIVHRQRVAVALDASLVAKRFV